MTGRTQDEDEDLADLKCFVLESMRDTLERNIDPTKFLPYLRSKFVISARESATIKACCSKSVYDGAEKFIDVLCTKGSKGYDQFCVAIMRDETQLHLLKALNKRLEREKHNRREQQQRLRQRQAVIQSQLRDPTQVRPYVPRPLSGGLGEGGAQSAHTTSCIGYIVSQDHYLRSRESPNQQFPTAGEGSLGYQPPSPMQQYPGSQLQSPSSVMSPGYQHPANSPLQSPMSLSSLGYQDPVVQPPGSLGFDNQFPYQPRAPGVEPGVTVPWSTANTAFSPSTNPAEDGPCGQTQIVP